MKFITEEDLRELYKKEPFTDYEIEPGARITPGARQFLADRGINKFADDAWGKPAPKSDSKASASVLKGKERCAKKYRIRIQTLEAMFLKVSEELLSRDVLLAQDLIALGRSFAAVRSALDSDSQVGDLFCKACTGINETNFCENMEDCFEITEFHIQLAKGREIILLHRLRCALRELEIDLSDFFAGCGAEDARAEEVSKKVNQIINTLSQLICLAVGGEKCQKK